MEEKSFRLFALDTGGWPWRLEVIWHEYIGPLRAGGLDKGHWTGERRWNQHKGEVEVEGC